ncbi:hypothetical protein [Endozoicomonas sp. ONNA2]|uniref:hypothetical protein n=1 Tax=Endozoicomonas sp. ONNA2 TaxID=2828741 RepID=UPI0021476ED7|nr:hypothetical protein [Endozoicomonas sp. ONNA2]
MLPAPNSRAIHYPVSVAKPLMIIPLPSDTCRSAAGSLTHPEVPVLFPTQKTGLYPGQPIFQPTLITFSPTQTGLTSSCIPQAAIPDTIMQFLPRVSKDPTHPIEPPLITPEKRWDVLKIKNLVISYGGSKLTATIDNISNDLRAGTGHIRLKSYNLKVGLRFISPLKVKNPISLPVQGKLCYTSKHALHRYLDSQPVGCFTNQKYQKVAIEYIPIFLKCNNEDLSSITLSPDTTEPLETDQEIAKIKDHLNYLNNQRVNARITFFDSRKVGGIACHHDKTSGYFTYFMFKMPPAYKGMSALALKKQFSHVRATIGHCMSDAKLSIYVASLGVDSFLNQDAHRNRNGTIQIFSHSAELLTDD